jgi:hypothetical protein
MITYRIHVVRAVVLVGILFSSDHSYAFDLTGAWTTDGSNCHLVFGKSKNGEAFLTKNSDTFGGGFIVRGKEIVGKIAKCSIKTTKNVGPVINLIAECSAGALTTQQFSFRIKNDNIITRIYPGVEELNTDYYRCQF